VTGPFGRVPHQASLRVTRLGTRSASANIALYDASGSVIAELSDCWFRRIELARRALPEDSALRIDLVPAPLDEAGPPAALESIGDILASLARVSAETAAAHGEQALLLDALVAAVALQTVLQIIDVEVPFTIDEVVEAGLVAPDSAPLFENLLDL